MPEHKPDFLREPLFTHNIKVGNEVVQIHGPCKGKVFVVDEVDSNMLHLRLKEPSPPFSRQLSWSHAGNYVLRGS